jgi:hypothetical protein
MELPCAALDKKGQMSFVFCRRTANRLLLHSAVRVSEVHCKHASTISIYQAECDWMCCSHIHTSSMILGAATLSRPEGTDLGI